MQSPNEVAGTRVDMSVHLGGGGASEGMARRLCKCLRVPAGLQTAGLDQPGTSAANDEVDSERHFGKCHANPHRRCSPLATSPTAGKSILLLASAWGEAQAVVGTPMTDGAIPSGSASTFGQRSRPAPGFEGQPSRHAAPTAGRSRSLLEPGTQRTCLSDTA